MKECEECGKTLGIFEGYQHPTMGKKHNVCNPCFDQVNASLNEWKQFVLSNTFNNGASKKNLALKWKDFTPSFDQRRNIVSNVRAETTILMRQR